jgi:hypothetical protein
MVEFAPSNRAVRDRLGRALLVIGLVVAAARCRQSEPPPAAAATPAEQKTAAGPCGDKGLPDCPTQAWMKANLQPYLLSSDGARLAEALDTLATAAPAGYDDWAAISKAAAKSARDGDLVAAKQACGQCHTRHRARFRTELRQRKIL